LRRNKIGEPPTASDETAPRATQTQVVDPIAIAEGDPLETVLLSSGGPIEVSGLDLDSEALRNIRAAGVELVVPLVGQGELLGVLYLGPRLSDQPYSTDDRRLMENLASQVAPAIKVAQLVRQQQIETAERERMQQELRVAALIQQTLLPRELPAIAGWAIDAFYRPARAVGGDFYDFIDLADGRLGVVIGDVTDKGVPAAMVMATCRTMLRAAANSHDTPGAVLADVNETLVPEIPPAMFVTCLYAIIDTDGGEVVFANAGHNLPYVRMADGVSELRATGMPLGLMPEMTYEEKTYHLDEGEVMVLTSDGITEAHDPEGEMYGFERLMGRVGGDLSADMCSHLVADLERFTGPDLEQEDDITLVVVQRTSSAEVSAKAFGDGSRNVLTSFSVPSEEGNERIAIDRVSEAVADVEMEIEQFERLKTAVGESVMNAMEHGNRYRADLAVDVEVADTGPSVVVRVTDHGDGPGIPDAVTPDIEAKIAGEQSPRGWGLFLIGQMVDEMRTQSGEGTHTVELVINKKGAVQ
jgi:serine phosphatase RsbU (regulator of sigma subunit)/anti-sigma regulatory factor (Ser/Thr protein kinase)